MEKISILNRFDRKNYFSYPYPFFFIDNAYEDRIYSYLDKDYKLFHNYFEKKTQYKENNIRLQISTEEFFESNLFQNSIWKDFVEFHTSKFFFIELMNIFEKDMEIIYPKINKIIKEKNNDIDFLNIRNEDNKKKFQFVADCQPGINTPNTFKSSVRDSHLDNTAELVAGLFYLKDDNDKSTGGDLQVMEARQNKKVILHKKSSVKNISDLKLFKEIEYKKNKVVFFLNTSNSIHRVTPRSVAKIPRNLTNIIFETYLPDNKLFSVNSTKTKLITKIKKLIGL
jgi:hypothetical protein